MKTPAFSEETLLHEEVEVLGAPIAERDDWQPLQDKLERLDHLYNIWRSWDAPKRCLYE